MPKKNKFTTKQVIQAITDAKGMLSAAARKLGCDYSTLWNYSKRFPAVQESIDNQREAVTDMAELKLFKAINAGEAWAVCFYLKTQGKKRGYVERHEHTGKDGNPLEVEEVDAKSTLISKLNSMSQSEGEKQTNSEPQPGGSPVAPL